MNKTAIIYEDVIMGIVVTKKSELERCMKYVGNRVRSIGVNKRS